MNYFVYSAVMHRKPILKAMFFNTFIFLVAELVFDVRVLANEKIYLQAVGMAGSKVLTSREVLILKFIEKNLEITKESLDVENKNIKEESFSKGLESSLGFVSVEDVNRKIFDLILSLEAESFGFNQLSPSELNQKLEKIRKNLKGQEAWEHLDVGNSEFLRLLKVKLTSANYWGFKTTTMSGKITDAEVLSYFEKNKVKFGGLAFEQMRENIRSFLTQQQLKERLQAYMEALKRKYKVRNILAEQIEGG